MGEKILFVHGAGGNSASWYFQKEYLEKHAEVILLDLPGRGGSGEKGCRSIGDYVTVVRETIMENGLKGCYAAGHSMGGLIVMSLGLAYPDLLKGLILIGTGARLRASPDILEWIMIDKEQAVKTIMEMAFSKKTDRSIVDGSVAEMMKAPAETIFGDFLACDQGNVMEEVKSLTLPTLIISGLDDLLTPPKYSTYLHQAIRGSELVTIPDAGHSMILEKPEEVNRAIETFVARRLAPSSREEYSTSLP
jgi:pimeloyl-ACP methyl ester carboxylesterase